MVQRARNFILRYVYGLSRCAYLFSVGCLVSSHSREMLDRICALFGFQPGRVPILVPEVRMADLAAARQPVQILEGAPADGNISLLELWVLCAFARWHKPKAIFEIGTFDGRTALNLAANAPEGTTVYTLDLPRSKMNSTVLPILEREKHYANKDASGSRFAAEDAPHPANRIVQLYDDSARFDYGPYRGVVDMVFVDGSHSYDYVRSDTKAALGMLGARKGVIFWHDYGRGWEGVTQALNELRAERPELNLARVEDTSLVYAVLD